MKQKRGQFYLIASLIIILVMIGFAGISNYLGKKEPIKLNNLKEELEIESKNVLDYGIYNEKSEAQMEEMIEEFINNYIEYAGEGKNLYFIYGDTNKVRIWAYQETSEEVSIYSPGQNPLVIEVGVLQYYNPLEDKVIFIISEIEYEFELKSGENFYFVISQEVGEEQHVVIG